MYQFDNFIGMLDKVSDEIIKDSFIFDFYKDDRKKVIKLGYRFIFQSNLGTLSDKDINTKINEVLGPILEIKGVSIPGM